MQQRWRCADECTHTYSVYAWAQCLFLDMWPYKTWQQFIHVWLRLSPDDDNTHRGKQPDTSAQNASSPWTKFEWASYRLWRSQQEMTKCFHLSGVRAWNTDETQVHLSEIMGCIHKTNICKATNNHRALRLFTAAECLHWSNGRPSVTSHQNGIHGDTWNVCNSLFSVSFDLRITELCTQVLKLRWSNTWRWITEGVCCYKIMKRLLLLHFILPCMIHHCRHEAGFIKNVKREFISWHFHIRSLALH